MAQAKAAPAATSAKRPPRTLAGIVPPPQDGGRAQVIAAYDEAIALLQHGKFDKAHLAFNKMLAAGPGDLADRVRMNISTCVGQLTKAQTTTFLSHEERFDFAVSLLNVGHYEDARAELKKILAANPTADYAFYGLAVIASMTGDPSGCLDHLSRAIHYNSKNRIQARADSDFQDMADDPRFTELLYPES